MKFRDEWEHDRRLVTLIKSLDQAGRLDILERHLSLPRLGPLKTLRRRKTLDMEVTFKERKLLIEAKVDSDEGNRWSSATGTDAGAWHTQKILNMAGEGDACLFFTYGLSEFYTKWFEFGAAAGSANVRHVRLDDMVGLLESALPVLNETTLVEWLCLLRIEQRRREAAPGLLADFGAFRRRYLDVAGEVDFTPTRMDINVPEIAFPAFARLLTDWRASRFCHRYGRLALYPASPRILRMESILNWREFWHAGEPLTLGGLLSADARNLHFEVGHDFNLHLKSSAEVEQPIQQVRAEVANRFAAASWPTTVVASRPEFRNQSSYALWQWDLDLPARIFAGGAVDAVGALLDEVVPLLS